MGFVYLSFFLVFIFILGFLYLGELLWIGR